MSVAYSASDALTLSKERQQQIIQDYLYVTGSPNRLPARYGKVAEAVGEDREHPLIKCGTSAVADFVINRSLMDPEVLKAAGLSTITARPVTDTSYNSPGGWFKIHYNRFGKDTVYQASKQTIVSGVPDYVSKCAQIADSVWLHDSTVLGYSPPPKDSFYPQGGDDRYDIYLINLVPDFYGLAYLDSIYIDGPGGQRATSFIELSKDYQGLSNYKTHPLDAVRVTTAHEFFHAIQFGIDFTEYDGVDPAGFTRRYWMEISAVWMEQEQYPNIPDYYYYLPYFFDDPSTSLQQFKTFYDLHPYGSCVFAIFLSERFGRDYIRYIWERCGALGPGPQFFTATDQILHEQAGSSLPQAFAEFALWNYFTGSRSSLVPANLGYIHRADYPEFPESHIPELSDDSGFVCASGCPTINTAEPEHNGAEYITFVNTRLVRNRYWASRDIVDTNSICVVDFTQTSLGVDSTELPEDLVTAHCGMQTTRCRFRDGCDDTTHVNIDTSFTVSGQVATLTMPWGVSVVERFAPDDARGTSSDSIFAESFLVPGGSNFSIPIAHPELCRSLSVVFTPSSTQISRYVPNQGLDLSYYWDEKRATNAASVNLPALVLVPYPNPAVVSQMSSRNLTFRFQFPTDATGLPVHSSIRIRLDLYSITGEHIFASDTTVSDEGPPEFPEIKWNMKNMSGREVASGVYIGVARLFGEGSSGEALVTESRVKVAVIR